MARSNFVPNKLYWQNEWSDLTIAAPNLGPIWAYAHIVTILCEYSLGLERHVQKYLIQLSCIKILFTGIVALLEDSGYTCSPFLMTLYLNPKTPQEEHFNRARKITQCTIEQTFWLLKRRFHVLHSEVRMAPHWVCTIIVACCTLHNLTVNLREPAPEDLDMDDEGAADLYTLYHGCETGDAVREHFAWNFCKCTSTWRESLKSRTIKIVKFQGI